MKKFTFDLKTILFSLVCVFFITSTAFIQPGDGASIIQQVLNQYHDSQAPGSSIKRFELLVTNNGFCKYRKVYSTGKTEFFSFNLARFKHMEYYGNVNRGELHLFTRNDDVIVQTRNDRKGNIDTMATQLIIPLKQIDAEQLNLLATQFSQLNQSLLATHK